MQLKTTIRIKISRRVHYGAGCSANRSGRPHTADCVVSKVRHVPYGTSLLAAVRVRTSVIVKSFGVNIRNQCASPVNQANGRLHAFHVVLVFVTKQHNVWRANVRVMDTVEVAVCDDACQLQKELRCNIPVTLIWLEICIDSTITADAVDTSGGISPCQAHMHRQSLDSNLHSRRRPAASSASRPA